MTRATLLLVVALAGCKGLPDPCDDYPGRTCISIEVDSGSNGPVNLDGIGIVAVSGLTLSEAMPVRHAPKGGPIALPALVAIIPTSVANGSFTIEVNGFDNGLFVGEAVLNGVVHPGDHVSGTASLQRPGADMAIGPDMTKPCTLWPNSGCGSGEACNDNGPDMTTCSQAGTHTTGQVCGGCVAGDVCAGSNSTAYCMQWCNTNGDCRSTPASQLPLSAANQAYCSTSIPPGMVCTIPCNPVLAAGASGCPVNYNCYAFNSPTGGGGSTGGEATDCQNPGTGTEGQPCTNGCQAGMGCFNHGGGAYSCRYVCRKGNNSDCTVGGETCTNITSWIFLGACCPAAGC